MSDSEKTYCGIGWMDKKGWYIEFSLNLDVLNTLPRDGYGNVRVKIGQYKVPSKTTKATHYAMKDDYFYDVRAQSGGQKEQAPVDDGGEDNFYSGNE